MIFASKYEDIPERIDTNPYIELSFMNFKVTDRNWIGETYIPFEEVSSFVDDIVEHDKYISPALETDNLLVLSFLIDTSVFRSNVSENIKLLEFLEELSDFEEESQTVELQKRKNKYFSKSRYYASKPENFGYMYRWATINSTHPLSGEIKMIVEQNMHDFRKSFEKQFDFSKVDNVDALGEDEFGRRYNKKEEESIAKLMKYSYTEPSLFFFNAYFVAKWFEQYKTATEHLKTNYVITQYYINKKVKTDIYQGGDFHNSCRFYQELMGDFLGLISDDVNWYIGNLTLISNFKEIDVHKEVLHSIAKWVTNKIYKQRKYNLPEKRWYTEITWDFLRDVGFREITFIQEKELQGESGRELIVYAKVSVGKSHYIVFPLIDISNWGSMNETQKALMTYSLCLYHDITVENAFDFDEDSQPNITGPMNPFLPQPKRLVFEGVKVKSKATKPSNANRNTSKHKPHKEHWVTFHFRKLKDGSAASEDAKNKASRYLIDVPEGFTFIDAHVRGGQIEGDFDSLKVSALDIFSKTIEKVTK